MLVISSREFRQNQKMYFDKVDKGERIIVQRGKNKSYVLTAVSEDDIYFNKAMLEKLKNSIQEAKEGKTQTFSTEKEIADLLGL